MLATYVRGAPRVPPRRLAGTRSIMGKSWAVTLLIKAATLCMQAVTLCMQAVTLCIQAVTLCMQAVTLCVQEPAQHWAARLQHLRLDVALGAGGLAGAGCICRVYDAGCRVQGAGCRVQVTRCMVQGARCTVQDAGCRVQGAGCRVCGRTMLDASCVDACCTCKL